MLYQSKEPPSLDGYSCHVKMGDDVGHNRLDMV